MNDERSQLEAFGKRTITFRDRIHPILAGIEDMLVEKNEAYGDSALNPIRVFSQADPVEQIRVRIDDKISRLARGKAAGEDVVWDLIGYLVILKAAHSEPVWVVKRRLIALCRYLLREMVGSEEVEEI